MFGDSRTFCMTAALAALVGVGASTTHAQTVPALDHIVVVIMENHSYAQVVGLPYTASFVAQGSSFQNSFAITHPSQPNYMALWAGTLNGVVNNNCPAPGSPFMIENLGHGCEAAGVSWRAYIEALPSVGYAGCLGSGTLYVRKHCPWTNFGNLDHTRERPYIDFALDVANASLPRLSVVIPDQCHNTHDCGLPVGDAWLSANLPGMVQAVGQRGVVILTYDEDDNISGNRILTCFVGPQVRPGYVSTRVVTHYTLLRTICDGLGIAPFGAAVNEQPIDDIWATISVESRTWGATKGLYR